MKVTRILAALLLLAVVAGAASAQEMTRLSWGSCDPQVINMNWGAPGVYKLVLSVVGASGDYSGHDTHLTIGPAFPLQDAWRFDGAGCQGGSFVSFSFAGFSKTCPTFEGIAPLAITNYGLLANGGGDVRIADTYNAFTANPAIRYTAWIVLFDHTYSTVAPTVPGLTCGGILQPENFHAETQFLHTSGALTDAVGQERDAFWQGGVVAAMPSTWSKVKGLYR